MTESTDVSDKRQSRWPALLTLGIYIGVIVEISWVQYDRVGG